MEGQRHNNPLTRIASVYKTEKNDDQTEVNTPVTVVQSFDLVVWMTGRAPELQKKTVLVFW